MNNNWFITSFIDIVRPIVRQSYLAKCRYNIFRTSNLTEAIQYPPLQLHSISPRNLNREVPGSDFREKVTPGMIIDGDWDQGTIEFHRTHFDGFKQRFEEGYPWEETVLYQDAIDRSSGNYWHGCDTEERVIERLEWYDSIYESIANNGYLTQRELQSKSVSHTPIVPELNEIIVHIDRHGEYIFDDGRHRLSIAKILDLDEVQALVMARHQQFFNNQN